MSAPAVDPSDLLRGLPEIITPAALALLFDKSTDQLANERHAGRGPAYVKYGSRVFYLRSDVVAFLSANRRDPAPEEPRPLRGGRANES